MGTGGIDVAGLPFDPAAGDGTSGRFEAGLPCALEGGSPGGGAEGVGPGQTSAAHTEGSHVGHLVKIIIPVHPAHTHQRLDS